MALSRYIAEENLVHNYMWYRLNRNYDLDGPNYSVTPLVKLIHTYHKQMSTERCDIWNEIADHIYDNRKQLKDVLHNTCYQIRSKNTTGSGLSLLFVAYSLAQRFLEEEPDNHTPIQTIIDAVDKHFVDQTAITQLKTSTCICIWIVAVTLAISLDLW